MWAEKSNLKNTLLLFSQESARLESAYSELHNQFKQVREKLEASQQTWEQIVAHMSDGLIFISQEGVITLFNHPASQMTRIPKEQCVGANYQEYFSDLFFGFSLQEALVNPPQHQRIMLTLFDEESAQEVEIALSSVPGKGILLLLTDRTKLEQLENSILQQDRLKELGQMAATLAHEIRNPLGGIEGFASLLKRDLELPNHKRMIEAILEGTRSLNNLVTNVLDYARPLLLHFSFVDLVSLIEKTVQLTLADNRPCHFITEVDTYVASVDSMRLTLVLLNLIRNAHEANCTSVQITLKKEGTIHVEDDGIGISQVNLAKVFTPFFTTKTTGTGLGLSEAHKVMQAHGGGISIDSQEGKGTHVILKLEGNYGN